MGLKDTYRNIGYSTSEATYLALRDILMNDKSFNVTCKHQIGTSQHEEFVNGLDFALTYLLDHDLIRHGRIK